jgi:DNA-binding Lrp family transcriptional regulator
MSQKLDSIDLKILDLLQEDGRVTMKKMSELLDLSTTPVFERIKKLEKGGYIKKYLTLLNHRKLNLKQVVFIQLSLKEHSRSFIEKFANEVKHFQRLLNVIESPGISTF